MGWTPIVMWWDKEEPVTEDAVSERIQILSKFMMPYYEQTMYFFSKIIADPYGGDDVKGLLWTTHQLLDYSHFDGGDFLEIQRKLIENEGNGYKFIHCMLHDG